MTRNLIAIGVVSAFTLMAAAAFAQNPPHNEDPNGAGMQRQGAQSAGAKKHNSKIQKQTNAKKNGTNQSEDVSGAKKNGQPK